MARAESSESVAETGGGGSSPLPQHNLHCMEQPHSHHTWPTLLTTTAITTGSGSGTGALDLHPNNHHLPPLHVLHPSWSQREERGPSALLEEQSDLEREEHQGAFSQQGPLPDLLPQNEHPSWSEALHELEVRRVANLLRIIGDDFNATILHREHAAPHWRDWRDARRGLFNFISQTLSTLYRLT